MEPFEIVGRFELLKHEVQKTLYEWLVVALPNVDQPNDWNQYVVRHLSPMQRGIFNELHYNNLKQLDFAMLLSVILGNWTRLINIAGFTNENRHQIELLKKSRNRWSHLQTKDIERYSPIGIDKDYIVSDLATMTILIRVISDDHPVIDKIADLFQGLYNGAIPDLNPGTTTTDTRDIEPPEIISQEIDKVKRKIPRWFRNPQNINSKILIKFLEGIDGNQSINYRTLKNQCNSITTFTSNYNQMKIIARNNHAKIFEESNGIITLWGPIKEFVLTEYEIYISQITNA